MTMGDTQLGIQGSVGTCGVNNATDTFTVQVLINVTRVRLGMFPIGVDGKVGPETIGAIRDFQIQSFGVADGRVDVAGHSFRRLVQMYQEPQLTLPKVYVRGRYKVTVGIDGRIFARPGDCLSKYSAAIYGDYCHVHDFGRMVNGRLLFLRNGSLIQAGEVLYHIPTWAAYMQGKSDVLLPQPPSLTNLQKEQISKEAIKEDFQLKGEVGMRVLIALGDTFQWATPIAEGVSCFLGLLEGVATALGLLMIPYEIYGNIRDLCNVNETDLRLYGMRATAYATTAWAFGDLPPLSSPEIRRHHQAVPKTAEQMRQLDDIWRTAASAAVRAQEQFARERLGPRMSPEQKKGAWQAALCALGDGNRGKLSLEIMKQLGEKALIDAPAQVRRMWEDGDNTLYP